MKCFKNSKYKVCVNNDPSTSTTCLLYDGKDTFLYRAFIEKTKKLHRKKVLFQVSLDNTFEFKTLKDAHCFIKTRVDWYEDYLYGKISKNRKNYIDLHPEFKI